MTLIIRDPLTLRSVWEKANERIIPALPLRAVDFDTEMVIVVSAGRMTTGDEISVNRVGTYRERGETVIAIEFTITRCRTFESAAFPIEIVRVPRVEGRVEWRQNSAEAPPERCR